MGSPYDLTAQPGAEWAETSLRALLARARRTPGQMRADLERFDTDRVGA